MPPRLARLLAVLAAVALVFGAFALRGALGDDGSPSDGSAGPGNPRRDGQPFRVLCDDDLGVACDVLASETGDTVEVVTAGEALALLTGEEADYDAWLTLDPWPAMLAETGEAGRAVAVTEPALLASSPLAILVAPETTPCNSTPTSWGCLAEPADPPVGLADPRTAVGALTVAAAVAGLEGRTDVGTNTITDEVRSEVADLLDDVGSASERAVAEQARDLFQPGNFSAVVTPRGRAEILARTSQGRQRGLATVVLEPIVTMGVVLVGIGPDGRDALGALHGAATGQTVGQALTDEGWTGPQRRSSGLPDPDVIFALQEDYA